MELQLSDLKKRDHLQHPGRDERIIWPCVLRKLVYAYKIHISGGLQKHHNWIFGLHEKKGIPERAKQISAFKHGFDPWSENRTRLWISLAHHYHCPRGIKESKENNVMTAANRNIFQPFTVLLNTESRWWREVGEGTRWEAIPFTFRTQTVLIYE